ADRRLGPRTGRQHGRRLFFFQAEDGIRDWSVTGVQTCALPICALRRVFAYSRPYWPNLVGAAVALTVAAGTVLALGQGLRRLIEIGRASCRERVESAVAGVALVQDSRGRLRS